MKEIFIHGKVNSYRKIFRFFPIFLLVFLSLVSCASRKAAQAEEYFSIGMAYYEMGKFAEAEQWLTRARAADRTLTASEYNLGRIAYENGRFEEAAKFFESILKKDPDNIMALKSAAYSRIKNGDLFKAETHYNKVLLLVPDSVDDGFNYALVLYGIKKYNESEEVLKRFPFALEENPSSMLLLARNQKALNKVEAIDSYANWAAAGKSTALGLYEYAQVLESSELYAKAIEQYRAAISLLPVDTVEMKRNKLWFETARLLLTADPENSEGLRNLNNAVNEGFTDTKEIEKLLLDDRIGQPAKDEIKKIIDNILNKDKVKEETPDENNTEETAEEIPA